MQRTLVLVKPDAMQRGLAGVILSRLEARGLKLVGLKLLHMDRVLAERHYAIHRGKPFFEGLINYITSSPIVAAVLEGPRVIDLVRSTMGKTDPLLAGPGTFRGDFCVDIGRNLVHGSDSEETARQEIALFFKDEELYSWRRDTDPWVFE